MSNTTADLAGWTRAPFTAAGSTHDVYRKGTGPGVVVVQDRKSTRLNSSHT